MNLSDENIIELRFCRVFDINFGEQQNQMTSIVTKRYILKQLASVYDTLGLSSPIIVKPELILQELWKRKIYWDREVLRDIMME